MTCRAQVSESPEVYKERVLPFIQAIPAAHLAWVYNILDKKVAEPNNPKSILSSRLCHTRPMLHLTSFRMLISCFDRQEELDPCLQVFRS